MIKRHRIMTSFSQIILDWFTIVLAVVLTHLALTSLDRLIGFKTALTTINSLLLLSLISSLLIITILSMMKVYRSGFCILDLPNNRAFTRALAIAMFASIIPFFFLNQSSDLRIQTGSSFIIITVLLLIQRSLTCAITGHIFKKQKTRSRLLVVGNGNIKQRLIRWADYYKLHGYDTVGIFTPDHEEVDLNAGILNDPLIEMPVRGNLREAIQTKSVNEVWISDKDITPNRVRSIIDTCHDVGVEIALAPDIGEWYATELEVFQLDGLPVIRTRRPVSRPLYELSKRLFDFIVSSFLMLLLAPLYIAITFWIKIDSKGPVTFKQRRVGENGRTFNMFKFRSMYVDTNPYAVSPRTSDDPRITRAGRFLRRSSLDELPQLYNVLRGDISLVGPRPEMPFVVEQYDEHQKVRLSVKQGITGLWQVAADRGRPIHENLQYDLYYIENRSLLLDFAILWRTVRTAAKGI